jgi:PIN domain nuclease of toxin-antitoxin system
MLLLDTHVWIWTMEGDVRRVGQQTRRLLTKAEKQSAVRVATATIFEVAALYSHGRLRLAQPLERWIDEALSVAGLRIAELPRAAAIDAGRITRSALADPLDRLLVATARQLGATFVTADQAILAYASATGAVRVHDAGS